MATVCLHRAACPCWPTGPPAGAKLGERIGFDGIAEGTAATPNQLNKQGKKALEFILTGGDLLVRQEPTIPPHNRPHLTTGLPPAPIPIRSVCEIAVTSMLLVGHHVVTQTNGDKEACWQGRAMMTSKGPVVVESLKQAKVM